MNNLISIYTWVLVALFVTFVVGTISVPALLLGQSFGILACALYPVLMYFIYLEVYSTYASLVIEPVEKEQVA